MAIVSGFRALHYNPTSISDLSDVITPPYDNIPAGDEVKYLERSPYNISHVLLPRKDGDYSAAAELLKKWREVGVLVEDSVPCYYLYRQNFTLNDIHHSRDTLMCAVQLCDFAEAIVRPHENTYGQFKADRLAILKQTKHNLSHIFGMVKDADGVLEIAFEKWEFHKPLLKAKDDAGVEHILWRMEQSKAPEIAKFFQTQPIYIVDGHHRYESALMYAREQNVVGKTDEPASQMIFAIANAYDSALIVYPTHRIVKGVASKLSREALTKKFTVTTITADDLRDFVDTVQSVPGFALYWKNELVRCVPKKWSTEEGGSLDRLAVVWSDQHLLKEVCGVDDSNRAQVVSYEKDVDIAWSRKGDDDMVIFHAPPSIEAVTDVADEKLFMPQKSTFFYPKLAAGLVMRRHEK